MPNVVSPFRVLLKSRCLISRNTVSSLRDTGPSFPLNAFMRVIVQHHITTNTPCLRFASVNLDGPVWWTGWTIIVYMLLLMLARLFSNKMATVQHELKGPGRKLGDLGDVGDLGELSPSYSSPSFRVGPICITRKLGDIWKSFRNFSKLTHSHCLSLYSLTACKRISFVL